MKLIKYISDCHICRLLENEILICDHTEHCYEGEFIFGSFQENLKLQSTQQGLCFQSALILKDEHISPQTKQQHFCSQVPQRTVLPLED